MASTFRSRTVPRLISSVASRGSEGPTISWEMLRTAPTAQRWHPKTLRIRPRKTSLETCLPARLPVRAMTRDASFLSGAGSVELELGRLIQEYGGKATGLEQYAIKAFGEAFEVI